MCVLLPPHLSIDMLLHHAVQRKPHPVPVSVKHVVTLTHQPAAEGTPLTRRKDKEGEETLFIGDTGGKQTHPCLSFASKKLTS